MGTFREQIKESKHEKSDTRVLHESEHQSAELVKTKGNDHVISFRSHPFMKRPICPVVCTMTEELSAT